MICCVKNKYKHKIKKAKNIPAPPDVEIGNVWKACGLLNWSSTSSFGSNLLNMSKKYLQKNKLNKIKIKIKVKLFKLMLFYYSLILKNLDLLNTIN